MSVIRGLCMSKLRQGFSLVEMLVVVVVLSLAMTAIIGFSLTNQRTAIGNEEVSEAQQNLRFAIDYITKDIHYAGFLVSSAGITTATTTQLSIVTTSPEGISARVEDEVVLAPADLFKVFTAVTSDELADFSLGDSVRIVRAHDGSQPHAVEFTVKAISGTNITLAPASAPSNPVVFSTSDLIVKLPSAGSPFPSTITWSLQSSGDGDFDVVRDVNGDAEIIASKMRSINFEYVNEAGQDLPEAPATSLTSEQREDVLAVRFELVAGISPTVAARDGDKVRGLRATAYLRNK